MQRVQRRVLLDAILSRLAGSSLKRGRGGGGEGSSVAAAAAADTQVAQWKPGGTQRRRREGGRTQTRKHANKRGTVASDGTPTEGPHRAAHREAH